MKDNNDGTFTIQYKAILAGNASLEVTVAGVPLKNSPYELEIAAGSPSPIDCFAKVKETASPSDLSSALAYSASLPAAPLLAATPSAPSRWLVSPFQPCSMFIYVTPLETTSSSKLPQRFLSPEFAALSPSHLPRHTSPALTSSSGC